MELLGRLTASAALVVGVLWFMWRLPRRGLNTLTTTGPVLALGGVWLGVASVAASAGLWWSGRPDWLVTVTFLLLDPVTIAAGVLVLWLQRGAAETVGQDRAMLEAVARQRQQAWLAIALGVVAVVLGYVFVMTHKQPFTPVGL